MKTVNKVLSIDVGGTMTKAAILPTSLSYKEFKEISVKKIPSVGWLNQSLPELLRSDLITKFDSDYDLVTICVPCDVNRETNKINPEDYYVKKNKVPIDLADLASQEISKQVILENDAVAWIKGSLIFEKMRGNDDLTPAFNVCLGTGIGMAVASSWDDIFEYNISNKFKGSHFKRLTEVAGYYYPFKNKTAGKAHEILGKEFFEWVRQKRIRWPDERIRKEFTERFIAFIFDLEYNSPFEYDNMATLFISGGNAGYLIRDYVINDSNLDVIFHENNSIGIDPDLLPLAGNMKDFILGDILL